MFKSGQLCLACENTETFQRGIEAKKNKTKHYRVSNRSYESSRVITIQLTSIELIQLLWEKHLGQAATWVVSSVPSFTWTIPNTARVAVWRMIFIERSALILVLSHTCTVHRFKKALSADAPITNRRSIKRQAVFFNKNVLWPSPIIKRRIMEIEIIYLLSHLDLESYLLS